MRSDLQRLSRALANHIDTRQGGLSIYVVGDIHCTMPVPAGAARTVLNPGWEQRSGEERIEFPTGATGPVLLYVPIGFLRRWYQFPEFLPALATGRDQLALVFFQPGLRPRRIQDFRWILSALTSALPPAEFEVALEFVGADRAGELAFWLRAPRRIAGLFLGSFRWALAYDDNAGVRADPERFSALIVSIKSRSRPPSTG